VIAREIFVLLGKNTRLEKIILNKQIYKQGGNWSVIFNRYDYCLFKEDSVGTNTRFEFHWNYV